MTEGLTSKGVQAWSAHSLQRFRRREAEDSERTARDAGCVRVAARDEDQCTRLARGRNGERQNEPRDADARPLRQPEGKYLHEVRGPNAES